MLEANLVPRERRMSLDEIMKYAFGSVKTQWSAVVQWTGISIIVMVLNGIPLWILLSKIIPLNAVTPASLSSFLEAFDGFKQVGSNVLTAFIVTLVLALLIDIIVGVLGYTWFLRSALDHKFALNRSFVERMGLTVKDLAAILPIVILCVVLGLILVGGIGVIIGTCFNDPTSISDKKDGLDIVINLIKVIVLTRISSWVFLMLEDKMSLMDALTASIQMSKGRMLRIFGYFVVMAILMFLATSPIMAVGIIVWLPAILSNFSPAALGAAIFLTVIMMSLASSIYKQVDTAIYAAIYYGLKRENEDTTQTDSADTASGEANLYL